MSLSPLGWRPRRHLYVVRPHRQKGAFSKNAPKPPHYILISLCLLLFVAVVVGLHGTSLWISYSVARLLATVMIEGSGGGEENKETRGRHSIFNRLCFVRHVIYWYTRRWKRTCG